MDCKRLQNIWVQLAEKRLQRAIKPRIYHRAGGGVDAALPFVRLRPTYHLPESVGILAQCQVHRRDNTTRGDCFLERIRCFVSHPDSGRRSISQRR